MNPIDIITARTRAVYFFGPDKYTELLHTAKAYIESQGVSISPHGVEAMSEYWTAINTIINDSLHPTR